MDVQFILIMLLIPYMIPSIIAYRRWHRSYKAIIALNILLGWTFLGWVVCLVWSLSGGEIQNPKRLLRWSRKI
ncbi:TPA: superinfection immunity protein [Klebsiella pneumoniae]|nr:superinfection immunity protein [Klebsiella pneumoniae]